MKKLAALLTLYVVCSSDDGRTRTIFEDVHNVYYAQQCLIFDANFLGGRQMGICDPAEECVLYQGVVASSSTVTVVK